MCIRVTDIQPKYLYISVPNLLFYYAVCASLWLFRLISDMEFLLVLDTLMARDIIR